MRAVTLALWCFPGLAAPCAAQVLGMYDDAFHNCFQSYSWGGGSDFANPNPVHGGSLSIASTCCQRAVDHAEPPLQRAEQPPRSADPSNTIEFETPGAGISLAAGTGALDSTWAQIRCNFIGTDPSGTMARGNGNGIVVDGGSTAIIGQDPDGSPHGLAVPPPALEAAAAALLAALLAGIALAATRWSSVTRPACCSACE